MASFEEQVQKAVDAREIPSVVLLACDSKGKFNYEYCYGPANENSSIHKDSTFILASCTKLMTAISALQCVERGQIALDDDISPILTELKDKEILVGFKEGTEEPIYKKAGKITLKHLLTHTSGCGYDQIHPHLVRWRANQGLAPGLRGLNLLERINTPLVFEPGTIWNYGTSYDWLGLLVMRLNNLSLDAYMQKYIWTPLGIKNMTFHQTTHEGVKKNLVKMRQRGRHENPATVFLTKSEGGVDWYDGNIYDTVIPEGGEFGGQGGVGSASDYLKIIRSLLLDDGVLLKSETINEMFTPQLPDEVAKGLEEWIVNPLIQGTFGTRPVGTKLNYGLTGMLIQSDLETGLKKGTLTWSGLPNLLWTIDRQKGLACFYACNLVPWGDTKIHSMQQAFEKEMYRRVAEE